MILAKPDMIPEIDRFASDSLGIPTRDLMHRAGEAVAKAIRSRAPHGSKVIVFAGKGNNGGDGYAAALFIKEEYDVTVCDVFGCGQRSDEGRFFLEKYIGSGGKITTLKMDADTPDFILSAHVLVDAVFGTGFVGEYPPEAVRVGQILSSSDHSLKIAIDVPLGVNAQDGSIDPPVIYTADLTVSLGFVKPGLISYPAKEYVGELVYDNLGLHNENILSQFKFNDYSTDYALASSLIPNRDENSNKGTFGKLLMIVGSQDFPGAARLSLEAALRSGVGLTAYLGEKELCDSLSASFPEVIYKPMSVANMSENGADCVVDLSAKYTAILVGSGSSKSEGLYHIVRALLSTDGAPVVLDADAINVLAENPCEGRALIRNSPRTVILTPHPLELARISGITTDEIQSHRLAIARSFAEENNCILVLKGAATIVTDGDRTYINTSGSSALAKAGSGDVLAGMLASVIASGTLPIEAAALSVYFHGLAADVLADEYSRLGVTPSDLTREIARQIAKAQKHGK